MRSPFLPESLLATFGVAVMEEQPDGGFLLCGQPPAWFYNCWPESVWNNHAFHLETCSQALACYVRTTTQRSTLFTPAHRWTTPFTIEQITHSQAIAIQAMVIQVDERNLLLLREATTAGTDLLPVASHQANTHHLMQEINKRDVLLHCMVHDLTNPLAGLKDSLYLMNQEGVVHTDGTVLLQIGLKQADKIQALIEDVVSTYYQSLEAHKDYQAGSDIRTCLHTAIEALRPVAALKRVTFEVAEPAQDLAWCVLGEPFQLEKVCFNLLEYVLHRTDPDTSIVVQLQKEGETIIVQVLDHGNDGESAAPVLSFDQQATRSLLKAQDQWGLYYCQITVEAWGGRVGYDTGAEQGSCLWMRLPVPHQASH